MTDSGRIVKCRSCGGTVAFRAENCPHCGEKKFIPPRTDWLIVQLVLGFAFLFILILVIWPEPTTQESVRATDGERSNSFRIDLSKVERSQVERKPERKLVKPRDEIGSRLFNNMTYEEVVRLVGFGGDRKRLIGERTVYEWTLADGRTLTATFDDRRLSQWNLPTAPPQPRQTEQPSSNASLKMLAEKMQLHSVDGLDTYYYVPDFNSFNAVEFLAAAGKYLRPRNTNFAGNGGIMLIVSKSGASVPVGRVAFLRHKPERFLVSPNVEDIKSFAAQDWRAIELFEEMYYGVYDGFLSPDEERQLRIQVTRQTGASEWIWDALLTATIRTDVSSKAIARMSR